MGTRFLIVDACALIAGTIALAALASFGNKPKAWSAAATWGGRVPGARAVVTIPRGTTVVLDADPPPLAELDIDGSLVIADERDVKLEAHRIVVRGSFEAGSAARRFRHRARIVLDRAATEGGSLSILGGGRLDIFGRRATSWLHLAKTAVRGERDISLENVPTWEPGDRIVIAPSGFDPYEAEERDIRAVDGGRITLDRALRFRHWGALADGVDERAEVGLLTHNVVVASDTAGDADGIGGNVTILRGGTLHASDVAFERLGERGRLGAYPVHFHLAGDGRDSFVDASSIVRSNNRCLTLHGTSGVTVSDVVAFDTIGHCYFTEDGVETANVFERDLGILTRAADPKHAILESDAMPATFWIANPANVLRGNVAAGSDGTGFWYDLSPHPTGPSSDATIWPRSTALGTFAANVAHTNDRNGLFVDILRNPPGITEAPNYEPPVVADFRSFTAYKNRRRGVWLRGTKLRLTHANIADNSIGVTFAGDDALLTDSLVVGESANRTGPPKPYEADFPIRGFEFYDGRVGVERTHFVNFESDRVRRASALGTLQYSPFFTDPSNFATALSFTNAEPVYLAAHHGSPARLGADGYRGTVFRDEDGSVTGRPGASVVLDTPLLADADCTRHAAWNALACDASYASVFVIGVGAGHDSPGPVRVAHARRAAYLTLYGNPVPGNDAMYQTNLRSDAAYVVSFAKRFPAHVRIGLHHLAEGHGLTLRFPQAPNDVAVSDAHRPETTVATHREGGALVIDYVRSADRADGTVLDIRTPAS